MAQSVAPAFLPGVELCPTGEVGIQGLAVAGTTTSGAQQVQFPCDGYVVGICATTRSGAAADFAGALLRVTVDSITELFTTGSAAAYKPFAQLSGPGAVGGGAGYWQTRLSFRQGVAWQVYVNNTTAATVTCDIGFAYINVSQPPV